MIPDEAVEAAFGAYVGGNEVTGPDIAGDFLTREQLRTILEAAAPHLAAAVWDEGEAAGQDNADSNRGYNIEHKYNPYRESDDAV